MVFTSEGVEGGVVNVGILLLYKVFWRERSGNEWRELASIKKEFLF